MGRRLILGFLIFACCGATAEAANLTISDHRSHRTLTIAGRFEPADVARVLGVLDRTDALREVRLDSEGGSLEAGIRIGEAIRQRSLATRVPAGAVCASACVYAFLGGIIRGVEKGGRVGIHMASGAFSGPYVEALRKILTDPSIRDVDDRIRLILLVSEQHAAVAARRQARFLAEMGVSLRLLDPVFDTPHIDVHWLTGPEMRDFNVVNE